VRCADPETAQVVDAGIGDAVGGKTTYEFAAQSVVGQRNGDISFAAAESGLEKRRLVESTITGRSQSEHDFTERNDFGRVHRLCTSLQN